MIQSLHDDLSRFRHDYQQLSQELIDARSVRTGVEVDLASAQGMLNVLDNQNLQYQ